MECRQLYWQSMFRVLRCVLDQNLRSKDELEMEMSEISEKSDLDFAIDI